MIRYESDQDRLRAEISKISPTWHKRAKARTDKFCQKKSFDDSGPIWSEVKPAFIDLQKNKCVFCERQFENAVRGTIEYDLEHFRPKSSVAPWPDPSRHNWDYKFKTGARSDAGYFWLAYDIRNYAASCKVCNTPLKSNYFPIEGKRVHKETDIEKLFSEMPLLCYPIGSLDEDPETLITFIATTAKPASATGYKRHRGQVIIDFFELNEREQLHRERAEMLVILGNALRALANGTGDQTDVDLALACVEADKPHAACSRAFRKLWDEDRDLAKKVFDACRRYFANKGDIPDFPGGH